MKYQITNFKIINLWGSQSFDIKIEDNTLVLIAENGAGKTTLLRIFYYFLSQQWDKLAEIDFESITAIINGKEYSVKKNEIVKEYDDAFFYALIKKYPDPEEKKFIVGLYKNALLNNGLSYLKKPAILSKFEEDTKLAKQQIEKIIKDASFSNFAFDYTIPVIFLPTYRRLEQGIKDIIGDLVIENTDEIKNPDDIKRLLQDQRTSVPEILNEIGMMFSSNKRGKKVNYLEVADIFGLDDLEHDLNLKFQKTSKEVGKNILKFLSFCNKYLKNKELKKAKDSIQIFFPTDSREYNLSMKGVLSSGEQQIVSFFYYLLLDEYKYFVIIDEPEISISVVRQEWILPDIKNAGSTGIIAATHSPLICNNNGFRKFTESIKNFYIE